MTAVYLRLDLGHDGFLFDSYLENVEQNDFKNFLAPSTPSSQRNPEIPLFIPL